MIIITMCSPMVVQFFDTMIVASSDKECSGCIAVNQTSSQLATFPAILIHVLPFQTSPPQILSILP